MKFLPEVKTCCFCCSLAMGCCIIGQIEMISGILSILHDIYILGNGYPDDSRPLLACGFMSDFFSSALQVVMGFALVVGVKTDRLRWVFAWLAVHIGLFLFSLCCYVLTAVLGPASGIVEDLFTFELLILVYTLRNLIIYTICIIVVNSFYERRNAGKI